MHGKVYWKAFVTGAEVKSSVYCRVGACCVTCDRVETLSPVTELDTVFMAHRYFTSQGARSWGGALLTETAWIQTWGV